MTQPIREEQGIQNEWYAEARCMTLKELPDFLKKLTTEYGHDYGTICHAIAAAAIAAAWAVEKSPQGGITGFQGGAVMWEFIKNWMTEYKDTPARIIKYSDMLYPQYGEKFRTISKDTWEFLQKRAAQQIAEVPNAHPEVLAHWESITKGEIPFGLTLAA